MTDSTPTESANEANRPDIASARRILPGRFPPGRENAAPVSVDSRRLTDRSPPPAPRRYSAASVESGGLTDPKLRALQHTMHDPSRSLAHRPTTHAEVTATLAGFHAATNTIAFQIAAWRAAPDEVVHFPVAELPTQIRWAASMDHRQYRVAINLAAQNVEALRPMDWQVVKKQGVR